MQKPTLQLITLGCSKNTVDSEHILASIGRKYELVKEDEPDVHLDYLLINTCGFIGDAKEESVNCILANAMRKGTDVDKLIVFGCLSERYADELKEEIPEVDAWFGAREFDGMLAYLGCEPLNQTDRYQTTPSHYAFLKISEGCDRRCSYCAIPFIRGAHKSVPMEILVEEARCLASRGVKELIVIAQDTTYYGLDLYRRRALAELLQKLSEVDGIEWIRIHYSYPTDFPDDVLDLMAENPKICRYMDIPLQHASDKVLDMMHRHINAEKTVALINRMREKVPGVVLRTTLIVGHPGEDEEAFRELIRFVNFASFERMGAFAYSEEEGTYGAEHYEDNVGEEEKQRRLDELMSVQSVIALNFNMSRVGKTYRVIVDSFDDGVFVCRSEFESPEVDGEIYVRYDSSELDGVDPYSLIGTFVDCEIIAAEQYDLVGKFIF